MPHEAPMASPPRDPAARTGAAGSIAAGAWRVCLTLGLLATGGFFALPAVAQNAYLATLNVAMVAAVVSF